MMKVIVIFDHLSLISLSLYLSHLISFFSLHFGSDWGLNQ